MKAQPAPKLTGVPVKYRQSNSRRIVVGCLFMAMLAVVFFADPLRVVEALSVTTLGVPITQNFDTLPASGSATWTNDSTLPGWYHARTGTGTTIVANNGSSNAGNLYSYGTGTATDRALGSVGSGNAAIGNLFWGIRLTNNTGATITSLNVSYVGEEWRNSAAAAQTVTFSYLVGSPTVTGSLAEFQSAGVAVPALDFTSPITGGVAAALDGNLAANRTAISSTITGLNIPNGTDIMLRWSDPDHTGADHGLSIDDFSVTANAAPVTPTLNINDVTQAETNAGVTTFTFTVSLTSGAPLSGVTFDIATQDGTAEDDNPASEDNDYVAKSLTGQTITSGNTSATFTVDVNGDNTPETNETFFLNVTNIVGATPGDTQGLGTISNDDVTLTPIHTIQGSGSTSPFVATAVTTTGIVTGTKSNGFFLQEPDASVDADPNTSEGIFVFTSSAPPAAATIGNSVQVTGTIQEFIPSADPSSPPLTELTSPTVVQLSSGNPLPAAITITAAETTQASETANPLDSLEEYEGMRVTVASLTVTGATQGTINEPNATVSSNGVFIGVVTGVARPFREQGIAVSDPLPSGAPGTIPRFDENPERIRVDSDVQPGTTAIDVAAGTVITNITGPLDYAFRCYTIDPDAATPPTVGVQPGSVPAPTPTTDEFTVVSFNMERFFDTVNDPATSDPVLTSPAFNRRLAKASLIIRTIQHYPDVIGVEEVENLSTLQAVAAQINSDAVSIDALPNPNYTAYLVEGNDIGGIDVGFLVKQSRITVVDVTQIEQPGCDHVTPSTCYNYVNPNDGGLDILNDRPPFQLRATCPRPGGGTVAFTVIVNHLRSLNGIDDNTADGSGTVGGRIRTKRRAQAEFLAGIVQSRQTSDPNELIITLGDMNAFAVNDGYVDSIGTIKGTPTPASQVTLASSDLVNPDLTNLVDNLTATQQYSYNFDGNAQTLDHIILNQRALGFLTRFAYARNDSDFAVKNYESTNELRISDHDQPVAYFNLTLIETVTTSVSSLPDFGSVAVGNTSAEQSYNVSGNNLTANININAPTDFQVSTTGGGVGFGSSVSITPVAGTVSSTPIYVRFAPGSAGVKSGDVTNASAGATTKNVAVSGTGIVPPLVLTITPAASPTAADNDYTRINNAVQAAFAGQTIKLNGTFNWTEANAAASWAKGSDGVASTTDDYSILAPANLNNVTLTADLLGDASIQGPGDLAAVDLEAVLVFNGNGDNQNWTISNLRFLDFDLSIGMFPGEGGADAHNNVHITNNYIRMARDLNSVVAQSDPLQNIGIHFSFGINQLISGNTIEIQGDAISSGSNSAADVGMQSTQNGGNAYDGLQITNNIIRVLNAQDATNPETILGIWDNCFGHTSNITISGNQFINQAAGNNPATNLQRGFRVTSHSSATTTVLYQNNTVMGANIGFQWIVSSNFAGNQPVILKSNTITGNGTGVLVQSQGQANLSFNRIVGNTLTGLNNVDGTVTAENNWWGCNAGPGNAGCDSVTGTADFNPWLVLGVSASPNPIPPGGTSTLTADMRINSDAVNTSGSGTLPLTPVSFSATQGTMAPPTGTITAGQATSTFTSNSNSSGMACATVDNQQICSSITITSVSFSIDDVTHNEGNAGTTSYTFTITKTGNTALNASVDYATVNGSATAPSDFTAIPATNLVFLPADTSKQVTVFVNGDTSIEPNEAFTVHLSNPSGATISDADGTGAITNDDTASANLALTKIDTPDPVIAGNNLTYTITVTNNGGSDAQSVQVSDALPASTTLVSFTVPAGWARTDVVPVGGTGTVTATTQTLVNGASAQFTLVVNVNGNTPNNTVLSNTANVSTTTSDPDLNNNSSTTTTTVASQADLTITKSHSGNFSGGQVGATYIITVTNVGTGPTSGLVTVTDNVPVGLTPTGPNGVVNGWTCAINGQKLTCTRSDTLTGGGASYPAINLTVNVANPAPLGVTNTATVSGGGEVNTSNNTASDPTSINCSPNFALNNQGPLMISRFRENGPAGPQDEFVEIFNPGGTAHTVASGNCTGGGYGVYASAGNGTTSSATTLVCYIPNGTVIPAGGYYLCTGVAYSLGNMGRNGGAAGATATGDAPIGCGGTCGANIPDDAGLALINKADPTLVFPEGFAKLEFGDVLYDKVGFAPYFGIPAPGYPSLAVTYCEGGVGGCLKPVGDAGTGAACANPSGQFPVFPASPACYGLAGQYEFVRRQTLFDASQGTVHQDTNNNGNDFILVAPNPAANMGVGITGVTGVSAVLGSAGPYNTSAPPDIPVVKLTRTPFDGGNQLGPRNAERSYLLDTTVADPANDPQGTFTLRYKYTNNSGSPINGIRFEVDNLATLCGPQTATATVATGDARNVGSSPDCGTGSFTAILKVLNSMAEVIPDSNGVAQSVLGTVMEDLSVAGMPGAGPLSPRGGGIDNTLIINPSSANSTVGDGVTGGVGNFATTIGTTTPTRVINLKIKFGVVRSGRFILLLVPMAKLPPAP